MNKKIIVIVVIVAVVAVVAAAFLLSGLFNPPVDISGINPPTTLSTFDLLPTTVADIQLNPANILTDFVDVDILTRTFVVEHTQAEYDGITVHVIKADSETDASETLDTIFEDWHGEASSTVQTPDWFTATEEGWSAFFWRSGVWVFGIDAGNDSTRNDAANDLVQFLKAL